MTTHLAIESGIPIPAPRPNGGRPPSPLLAAFKANSVLVGAKDSGCCLSSIKRNGKEAKIKITSRLLTPEQRRIWRVK